MFTIDEAPINDGVISFNATITGQMSLVIYAVVMACDLQVADLMREFLMIATSESRIGTSQIEPNGDLWFYGLLPAFRRLDERLKLLLAGSTEPNEFESDTQPYPGLIISKSETELWLEHDEGERQ